jgi:hypothetical protein
MHKLGGRNLSKEDFQLRPPPEDEPLLQTLFDNAIEAVLHFENKASERYSETKDFQIVRSMKSLLCEGFLQRATMTYSYETLLSMWMWRHNHRMQEWSGPEGICPWIQSLPYMDQFIEAAQQRSFTDARKTMVTHLNEDEGTRLAYQSTIAMFLHDELGPLEEEQRNNLANLLLNRIFEGK